MCWLMLVLVGAWRTHRKSHCFATLAVAAGMAILRPVASGALGNVATAHSLEMVGTIILVTPG